MGARFLHHLAALLVVLAPPGSGVDTFSHSSSSQSLSSAVSPLAPSGCYLLHVTRRPGGDAQVLTVASHGLALRSEIFPNGHRFSPWRALAKQGVPEGNQAGRGVASGKYV